MVRNFEFNFVPQIVTECISCGESLQKCLQTFFLFVVTPLLLETFYMSTSRPFYLSISIVPFEALNTRRNVLPVRVDPTAARTVYMSTSRTVLPVNIVPFAALNAVRNVLPVSVGRIEARIVLHGDIKTVLPVNIDRSPCGYQYRKKRSSCSC